MLNRLTPVALAAAFLLAMPALAQETEEKDDSASSDSLPTVEVKASAMQTTTGMELSVRQTPQSVTVMSQQQLKERGINTMNEALKTTTGINVIRDGNRVRYQSRGFYIDQIEEDGMASTVAAGNSGNPYRDAQSMTDMAIYDHVEVVRGPTGLTQANGEPGGTINAVRKKPTTQRQASMQATADHRGGVRLAGDASGSLNEAKTVRGRLVAVGEKKNSFKRDVDGDTGLLYGVMDAQLGSATVLTAGGMYQRQRDVPDTAGLPMGLGGVSAGFPADTFLGLNWNRSVFTKKNVFAEVEHYFSDDWKLNTKINHIDSDSESRFGAIYNASASYRGLPPGGVLAINNLQNYVNDGKQTAFQTNLNGKYNALGRSHDLFATYTYSHEKSHTRWRRVRNSTAFNPFTFTGNEVAEPNWETDYNDQTFYGSTIKSHGLSLGTRFNATDALHIIAGGRYTRWRASSFTDYNWWNNRLDTDADEYVSRQRNRFIPYLGLTYDLNDSVSFYASYTSIFKPQGATDLQGNVLPPVIGKNYEIGVKSSVLDHRLNLTAALFSIDQENRAVTLTNPQTNRSYSVPSGRVRSHGIDLEASGLITPAWQIFAGYTFNTSKYKENESSRYLAGMNFSKHTPKHMLRLYTSYRLPGAARQWTVGGGMSVQSKTSSVYNVHQGGWAVFNANVQYEISPSMSVRLIVNNLTNRRYYENHKVRANGINNFYEQPRTVSLNFLWKM